MLSVTKVCRNIIIDLLIFCALSDKNNYALTTKLIIQLRLDFLVELKINTHNLL